MSDMVADPHVLVIGLDPFTVPGPWDPKPVAEAIETGMAALANRGFDTASCLLGLDGGDDTTARLTSALRARTWDCVVIGGGLRKEESQLELFESTINLVRRHAPQAAIAFNSTPHDLADAAERSLR